MQVYRAKEYVRNSDSDLAKGEKKDCTVYAFASSFGTDYETAHDETNKRFGRSPKNGPKSVDVITAMQSMLSSKEEVLGCKVTEFIKTPKTQTKWRLGGEKRMRRMRIKTFLKEYSTGTYFILVRGHALTIKDGNLIDNNPGKFPEKRIVDYAFKVEATK
jgi:hypothetical protein